LSKSVYRYDNEADAIESLTSYSPGLLVQDRQIALLPRIPTAAQPLFVIVPRSLLVHELEQSLQSLRKQRGHYTLDEAELVNWKAHEDGWAKMLVWAQTAEEVRMTKQEAGEYQLLRTGEAWQKARAWVDAHPDTMNQTVFMVLANTLDPQGVDIMWWRHELVELLTEEPYHTGLPCLMSPRAFEPEYEQFDEAYPTEPNWD
jgi:hypothetical protein